jgi:hypothetical protein
VFDVFYFGEKPNLFPHERAAANMDDVLRQCRTRMAWVINAHTDYSGFDFTWEPPQWEAHQRHAWASQWQKDAGIYLIPKSGYADTNYRGGVELLRMPCGNKWQVPNGIDQESFDFSWHPDPTEPPFIYQFGTQWQKTGGPRYMVDGATQVKFAVEPRATALPSRENWEVPDGFDSGTFDFSWHPDATEIPFIYQFGTQWQKTGGPRYFAPDAVEVKYVSQAVAKTAPKAKHAIIIDFSNGVTRTKEQVEATLKVYKVARFVDTYLDTLRRVLATVPDDIEYVWVCSSVCDYDSFDFSWHPSKWQSQMLHVFPSDNEKFGDTFFVHVPSAREKLPAAELLEWYDLNFVEDQQVPRRPLPTVKHGSSSHPATVKECQLPDPLILFSNIDYRGPTPAIPLWREKTRTVTPLTTRGSAVIVPRSAIPHIKTQLWDCPFVDKSLAKVSDEPLDVIYISNGEPTAEANWKHLQTAITKGNRVERVDGVNGRVAAYKAAAGASKTPWFFAIFAKLEVDRAFDFEWQPDCLQEAKHYIFYAKNPINGLVYGHQAAIAYNKELCMVNDGIGLDFTLDQAHEVVPMMSGIAIYNSDPWTTWRTAFRETLKLKVAAETSTDYAVEHRLKKWVSAGVGEYAEWSQKGALDALSYYDQVAGDFDQLKLSYEWEWLRRMFEQIML